ncbi:MAG: DUF1104 domain-containing protein [Sulfurospirillaceae bacterium]|nr:DUF1104 domain-containing protein [Sulfurospirillaceae bacterium]MDD2826757.1 DUF1104 domain-containing protein [Sulfurospirillaceae bacterium]
MKKTILALTVLGVFAFGADYSAMSATELAAMRGSVPVEDRVAFQAAMQEKMKTMTQEERQTLTQARTSNPGTGSMGRNSGAGGTGSGSGVGGGSGSGHGGGNGKGGRK